jgi:hypothetical protein
MRRVLLLAALVLVTPLFYFYIRQSNVLPTIEALQIEQPVDLRELKGNEDAPYGYVMALHYSDQMTASTLNLVSLQCWAHSLAPKGRDSHQYVKVVEPFVRRSVLGLDDQHRIHMNNTAEHLKSVTLSDVYDIAEWEHFTASRKHYAPLVSWEQFLKNSPRKMIIVERECFNEKKCMECGDGRTKDLLRSIKVLQGRYGFEVVRRVCYPLRTHKNSDFKTLIYADYAPHEVVVVINYWGGVERELSPWRIPISDMRHCGRGKGNGIFQTPFSLQLRSDALQYARKYISTSRYVSVMIRLEYFYIKHKELLQGKSKEEILQVLGQLYDQIATKTDYFKSKHNIKNILLTMDSRKQGSEIFSSQRNTVLTMISGTVNILYNRLYGNSSTLEEWDQSFYNVSSFKTEGYLAMLQKYLAASGTCLITAGGGTFQETAIKMYHQYNPGLKCVYASAETLRGSLILAMVPIAYVSLCVS